MGRRLLPRCGRDQGRGDSGEFFGIRTKKMGVCDLGAALEFETNVAHKQPFRPNFLEIAPVYCPDALSPASVTLDGKKQKALVDNEDRASCQERRPPSSS